MNDIERINKALNGIIDLISCSSIVTCYQENAKKITEIKDLINQPIEPTQPEGYQGLNKWYLTDNGSRIRIVYETNDGILIGYGLNGLNCWDEDYHAYKSSITRELTEQEATQTILKGCEQNGIVDGAVVTLGAGIFKIELGNIEYVESTNALWMSYNNEGGLDCGKVRVFGNGKFAEVVKEEKESLSDRETLKISNEGKEKIMNVIKDFGNNSTDKELLKECMDLINYYQNNFFNINSNNINVKTQDLLTKLNKHLNHE